MLEQGRIDQQVEDQFRQFDAVLSALREIRSRQNIPPRKSISFRVQCDAQATALLLPMKEHFVALAQAQLSECGPDVQPPCTNATVQLADMGVFVDLAGLIDVDAEIERLEKQLERLTGMITGKEKKLGNQKFVERAPAEVVQRERESLSQLQEQRETARSSLASLRGKD